MQIAEQINLVSGAEIESDAESEKQNPLKKVNNPNKRKGLMLANDRGSF